VTINIPPQAIKMKAPLLRHIPLLVVSSLGTVQLALGEDVPGNEDSGFRDEISYTHDIRPLVENFCTTYHSGESITYPTFRD